LPAHPERAAQPPSRQELLLPHSRSELHVPQLLSALQTCPAGQSLFPEHPASTLAFEQVPAEQTSPAPHPESLEQLGAGLVDPQPRAE
jgi:hypothetical protein